MGLARRARTGAARAAAVSAVLVAALLAGCADADQGQADGGEPSKAAASTEPVPEDALDPAHAVAAPGEFTGTQYGDDLLLVSDETIPDEDVDKLLGVKVKKNKGVAAHTLLSYGSFTVDGKVYNVAAVDGAAYRGFTGSRSAEFQEQWDRIAGGEVAVMDHLQKELPIDGEGYLQIGKQRLHVGAWSPAEVESVDVMINSRWGEELGLPENNAVLINTGIASPQAVRERIEKAFGKERFSITALDIVASEGLDLGTFQNVVPVGAFRDAVGTYRYTPIGGGRIAPDPAWVRSYIVTEQVPILGRVTCNKHMMPQLRAALIEVVKRGLAKEIHADEYAGCYYPRFIAGSTKLSNHSFGLALDFNVPGNQRGTVGQMNREVVAIFKYWGFAWGGDWAWTDPMHFELERIVSPG
ncbi:M15 family metallopeptidase [Nocardioides sp. J54]|uniref:M15 family metallopeptidase n=1 Tax=Nocardioides sp. J54 TaxID=935866 RepID=UPI0004AEE215|nr:M15 family metallopeptidase [Nocardioides sp. J54]